LRSKLLMKQTNGMDKSFYSDSFLGSESHIGLSSETTNLDDGNGKEGDDGIDRGEGGGDGGEISSADGTGEEPPALIIKPDSGNTTEEKNTTKESAGQRLTDDLRAQNDANVQNMFKVIDSSGWKHVVTVEGEYPVTVWKKTIEPGTYIATGAANDAAAAKFACIKATAIIDAPPREVYKLFLDNLRVNEYNEHCAILEDVERLSKDTKIAWSATNPMGMVKARDFLTMVHYRKMPDGTFVVVNRPAVHPSRPAGGRYQRAEILLAGNVMKPVKGHPEKTALTLITHVNPGGIVDNPIGAALINTLTSKKPVEYIEKLEAAARKTMRPGAGPHQKIDMIAATEAIKNHLHQQRAAAESMVHRLHIRCREATANLRPPGGP